MLTHDADTPIPIWAAELITEGDDSLRLAWSALPLSDKWADFAKPLLSEFFTVASNTTASIILLMKAAFGTAANHTESAAVLSRRLIEVFAVVAWIAEVPEEADVRALRVELKAVQRLRETGEAMIPLVASIGHYDMEEIGATESGLIREIEKRGQLASPRPGYLTMLKGKPQLQARYRFESGAAHAELIGRVLQRPGGVLGAPAERYRQAEVLALSIPLYVAIARICLDQLGYTHMLAEREWGLMQMVGRTAGAAGISPIVIRPYMSAPYV